MKTSEASREDALLAGRRIGKTSQTISLSERERLEQIKDALEVAGEALIVAGNLGKEGTKLERLLVAALTKISAARSYVVVGMSYLPLPPLANGSTVAVDPATAEADKARGG